MSKKKKKDKPIYSFEIDERSTKDTFLKWLRECGNDLYDYSGILSCSGSDGPDITNEKVGRAHFNKPMEVEMFLISEDLYTSKKVMCDSVDYTAPSKHYIDWFNEKYGKKGK